MSRNRNGGWWLTAQDHSRDFGRTFAIQQLHLVRHLGTPQAIDSHGAPPAGLEYVRAMGGAKVHLRVADTQPAHRGLKAVSKRGPRGDHHVEDFVASMSIPN